MWGYYSFVAEHNVTLDTYLDLVIVNIESHSEKLKISFFPMEQQHWKSWNCL